MKKRLYRRFAALRGQSSRSSGEPPIRLAWAGVDEAEAEESAVVVELEEAVAVQEDRAEPETAHKKCCRGFESSLRCCHR